MSRGVRRRAPTPVLSGLQSAARARPCLYRTGDVDWHHQELTRGKNTLLSVRQSRQTVRLSDKLGYIRSRVVHLEQAEQKTRSSIWSVVSYVLEPFQPAQWLELFKRIGSNAANRRLPSYRRVIIEALLYYVLLSPMVAMPFYNTLIFHPAKAGDFGINQVSQVAKEDVYFQSTSRRTLHGWFFKNPGATKTVLISHGNAGNITNRLPLLRLVLDAGASAFIYDYEGFGRSEGSPSVDAACADGLAAYDYLTKIRHISASSVVLYGESIGTGITCRIAARRQCAAVILQSGYTSLPALARQKIPFFALYPDWMYPIDKLDNLSFVKDCKIPVLLIHGKNDRVIPAQNSESLFASANAAKGIIRLEAEHNDCTLRPSYQLLVSINSLLN